MKTTLSILFAASMVMGASLPATQIRGNYVEARNADIYTGPCFAMSEVDLVGDLAVFGWKITEGSYKGVKLDGLGVVGVVKASSTLGNAYRTAYPVKSVMIIDEKATPEQRLALRKFAQEMSGDLLTDVVKVAYQPVSLTFENDNVHTSKAILKAGNMAAVQTRPIQEGDHLCSNELIFYPPLTKLDHAMPAVAKDHQFRGEGLGTTWSSPDKRSAFVGSFHYND